MSNKALQSKLIRAIKSFLPPTNLLKLENGVKINLPKNRGKGVVTHVWLDKGRLMVAGVKAPPKGTKAQVDTKRGADFAYTATKTKKLEKLLVAVGGSAALRRIKPHSWKEVWQKIPDTHVRHIWTGNGETTTVFPSSYDDSGIPIDDQGNDMKYSHTEILTGGSTR